MAKFYPMPELVEAVKAYALEHYNDGGWDVIVEAWDDRQIESVLRGEFTENVRRCRSPKGVIRRIYDTAVTVYKDSQADARISAGESETVSLSDFDLYGTPVENGRF